MGICPSNSEQKEEQNKTYIERVSKSIIRFKQTSLVQSENLQIQNLCIDIIKQGQKEFQQTLPLQIKSRSSIEFIKQLREDKSLVIGYRNKLVICRICMKKMTKSYLAMVGQAYFKTRCMETFEDLIYFSLRNCIQLLTSKKTKIIRKLILRNVRITLIKTNSRFQLLYQTSENLFIWNPSDGHVSKVPIGVLNLYHIIESSKDLNVIYTGYFNRLSRLDLVHGDQRNVTFRYPPIQRNELDRIYYFSQLVLSPDNQQIIILIVTQHSSLSNIPFLIKILNSTSLNLEWESEDFYKDCRYTNDGQLIAAQTNMKILVYLSKTGACAFCILYNHPANSQFLNTSYDRRFIIFSTGIIRILHNDIQSLQN